ncbi:GDP-L-galactose phosphorylase 1 [Cucurbita argyrosperma subsp. argyrosperma]|nr:GDP-L-galactose phosphorylase 1 [Cucurbita argyrosperma subsp. argyrosperma]
MLRIKRVPTVVSNFQKDEAEEVAPRAGCGRNCLNECCYEGAKIPLYAFKKLNKISKGLCCEYENTAPPFAFLDSLLLGERPTEFRVDKVLQPFDGNKFNFTKVGQEEILFRFEANENGNTQLIPNAPLDVENSPSMVAINVSPIEYGHVLLIPRIFERLPQRIDRESFLLALHMAAEAGNTYFRLGYNSLGAFATINHLHFQAYYLAVPFPIEKAPTKKTISLNDEVIVSKLLKYPVRGLVFEGENTLQALSNAVSDACICLQENNIPYNCYAEKQALGEVSVELLDTQVNPAVWEISGHMVLKRKKDYDEASEENAWRLLAEVSLSEERFQEVCALIFEVLDTVDVEGSPSVAEEHGDACLEEVEARNNASRPLRVTGTWECLV